MHTCSLVKVDGAKGQGVWRSAPDDVVACAGDSPSAFTARFESVNLGKNVNTSLESPSDGLVMFDSFNSKNSQWRHDLDVATQLVSLICNFLTESHLRLQRPSTTSNTADQPQIKSSVQLPDQPGCPLPQFLFRPQACYDHQVNMQCLRTSDPK